MAKTPRIDQGASVAFAARCSSRMMETMQAVTENEIVAMVDAFYAKVRRDEVLAPVFERAIAPGRLAGPSRQDVRFLVVGDAHHGPL